MSEYSVELKGLNKVYSNLLKEDTIALKDINLQIRPGEFISIIGPSGCGKSTLLRIIGNLDKPTSGTIEYRDGADQQMGFVFQDSVLLPWKNVRQNAEFPLVIQKKQTKENEEKLDELLELAGLSEFKTALPRELSGGMKQRLGIGLALVGEPDLLVLDEPINGLDPQGIAEIRDTIQRLQKEKNMTICISSHILEELSKIATDYGIIHNGSLLQEITREELIRRCSERIELTLDHPKQAIPVMDSMGFTNYQVTDKEHIHIFERLNESAALNMELAKSGIPVKGISITSEELETYFLNLTGGADHA